jgi:hypothetical protein
MKAEGLQGEQADEGADHEDVEMGEINQFENAVDQGETKREQGVDGAEREAVDDLLDDEIKGGHGAIGQLCGAVPT